MTLRQLLHVRLTTSRLLQETTAVDVANNLRAKSLFIWCQLVEFFIDGKRPPEVHVAGENEYQKNAAPLTN